MISREQICEDYEVKDGVIVSPGQFEGEKVYVPYFWESGDGQEIDEREFIYIVNGQDREQFPELEGVEVVRLYLSEEQGFVFEMTIPDTVGA